MYHSFIFAKNGLVTTWKEEHNFRFEILVAVIVLFTIIFFDFSPLEATFCILAITLVLIAEILNTAVEDLCNKVEPQHDPIIGKIKDTMAAFVLISCLGAGVVGLLVFYNHFVI